MAAVLELTERPSQFTTFAILLLIFRNKLTSSNLRALSFIFSLLT